MSWILAGTFAVATPTAGFAAEGREGLAVAAAVGIGALLAGIGILSAWVWRAFGRLRRGNERLTETATRGRAIIDAIPGGVFWWDRRIGGEGGSDGLAELLGFPPGSPIRFRDVLGRLHDESRAGLEQKVAGLRGEGGSFRILLRAADGERRFDALGRRVADDRGGTAADVLWIRDATEEAREAERLSAEAKALAGEGERLRRTLDVLPFPVWRRTPDLTLTYCNRALSEVSEGKDVAFGITARAQKALAERALKTGSPQSESRYVVIKGERRLVETTEAPLAGSGEVVGYVRDFTDLENVQAALARHIDAHAEVLEKLATAIVIYGPDTRVKFFNRAYANLWGLDEGWLRQGPTFGEVLEALREKRRLPETVDFPAFKRGRLAWFTTLIEPKEELLHLPDGSTLRMVATPHPFGGLLCTLEDITDKLALESSYNTLIAVQRETLDNLYEGVAVFGADGRLKLSNPAFLRMWRLPPEFVAEKRHVSRLVEHGQGLFGDGEDWGSFREGMIARITERAERSGRLERNDGTVVDYASVPLPDGAVLWTCVDVTDSIRAERALRERNEALERADRLKSEFLAHVSYELRTPLNTIIGFAEILDDDYFGVLNERQREYARGILDSSRQLLSLITNIIDLASIEAGYLVLEFVPVDVHEALASVLTLTREQASRKDLGLHLDCPERIGSVVADDRRLRQAIYHLVSNSIRFAPAGGSITLSAKREAEDLVLEVADTGIGIPEKDQGAVFEKFERGGSRDPRESGAGLGLSLAKSLVELHGGRLDLRSRPGQGPRMICRLPLQAASRTAATVTDGG